MVDFSNSKKIVIAIIIFYVLTISSIQLIAPSEIVTEMPERCPEDSANCARIAHDGTSYRIGSSQAISIEATPSEVQVEIEKWLDEQFSGGVLYSNVNDDNTTFIHGVDRTSFWFFPDDVYTEITCDNSGKTLVTLQSESRLGIGDLNKNPERVSDLMEYLTQIEWSGNSCI